MTKEHYNHWFPKLINARGVTIYNHIFYLKIARRLPPL